MSSWFKEMDLPSFVNIVMQVRSFGSLPLEVLCFPFFTVSYPSPYNSLFNNMLIIAYSAAQYKNPVLKDAIVPRCMTCGASFFFLLK